MARHAGPWYRKRCDQWYTTLGGVQRPLGVYGEENKAQARVAFQELVRQQGPRAAVRNRQDPSPDPTSDQNGVSILVGHAMVSKMVRELGGVAKLKELTMVVEICGGVDAFRRMVDMVEKLLDVRQVVTSN